MKATKHRRWLFLVPTVSLAIVAAVMIALFANPFAASATHSWNGYHWARTSNPFTVKLGDNLTTADWKSHLSQTSSDWSKSTVLNTTVVTGNDAGKQKRCPATAGRDEICNASYGNNGWLGVAQIWLQSGTKHITQGTVKVNDYYFNQAKYNNAAEREHVMCQEVGHTFGLDHQDTSGASLNTCMDYYQNTSSSDTKSTTPNQHDYDELATIYSHLDSSTTVGAAVPMSPEVANGDFSDKGQWGKLVKASADGRTATYAREFSSGELLLTFVIWAK